MFHIPVHFSWGWVATDGHVRHDFEFSFVSGGSSNKLQNWTWSAVNICPVLQAIQSSALYGIHPSARDSMKGT